MSTSCLGSQAAWATMGNGKAVINHQTSAGINLFPEHGFGYGFATLENPSWTLQQLLKGCAGELLYGDSKAAFRSISTDSRTIRPGDVFLALNGDNFVGSSFIDAAIKNGAACIIAEDIPEAKIPAPLIIVKDSLFALGELARYRRNILKGLTVVGITGSSGKTTVKEMVATILALKGQVIKTKGNFNNLVGLPLSLLPANYRHDFAIMEMGMNRRGEIARLTEIARPDVACILNVHNAHVAGVGSIEGVARAKGELFTGCGESAKKIINFDDRRVAGLVATVGRDITTFGLKKGAFVRASRISAKGISGTSFTIHIGDERGRVNLPVLGKHNVSNCLAAAAIAHALGIECSDIIRGLKEFVPTEKRLEVSEGSGGIILVNDSYNANPSSMRAAIETVSGIRKGAQTVAVLGDMLELGDYSRQAHQEIGEVVARNDFDYLLTVGNFAQTIVDAARKEGMAHSRTLSFTDKEGLAKYLTGLIDQQILSTGDILLFKGSRGMRMETFLNNLKAQ